MRFETTAFRTEALALTALDPEEFISSGAPTRRNDEQRSNRAAQCAGPSRDSVLPGGSRRYKHPTFTSAGGVKARR